MAVSLADALKAYEDVQKQNEVKNALLISEYEKLIDTAINNRFHTGNGKDISIIFKEAMNDAVKFEIIKIYSNVGWNVRIVNPQLNKHVGGFDGSIELSKPT